MIRKLQSLKSFLSANFQMIGVSELLICTHEPHHDMHEKLKIED